MSNAYRQRLQLTDVWEAARTERNFDYVFWANATIDIIVNNMIKKFGYFLVFVASLLITALVACGFLVVLPAITTPGTFSYYFHRLFGAFITYSIVFHYYHAVTTKPGSPSDLPPDDLHDNFCKKCNAPKPERAHHCSICNQCVLRMDHHCPWLANCVGLRNHKYFLSFLFWVTLGTLYLALLCTPKIFTPNSIIYPANAASLVRGYFSSLPSPGRKLNLSALPLYTTLRSSAVQVKRAKQQQHLRASYQLPVAEAERERETERRLSSSFSSFLYTGGGAEAETKAKGGAEAEAEGVVGGALASLWGEDVSSEFLVFFSIFLVAVGVCLATSMLLSMHLYLVYTNQTTLELFQPRLSSAEGGGYVNPHDKGARENLREVLHSPYLLVGLLPMRAPQGKERARQSNWANV